MSTIISTLKHPSSIKKKKKIHFKNDKKTILKIFVNNIKIAPFT